MRINQQLLCCRFQTPGESDEQPFFIEVGANDGEFFSNTLWFERNWNWTGLLIEPDKATFSKLVSKNRKAWLANVCLAPSKYPGKVSVKFIISTCAVGN
jgi:hypothetical protein